MPALKKFNVSISRSATETAWLEVLATSQDAADTKVSNFLDQPERVSLDDLHKLKNVKVIDVDLNPDEESSWEVT